jgi:hypothetical protein
MAVPGQAISVGMANRWAFEALGRGLDVGAGHPPAMASYADAFTGSALTGCLVLAAMGAAFTLAAVKVLATRTRRG